MRRKGQDENEDKNEDENNRKHGDENENEDENERRWRECEYEIKAMIRARTTKIMTSKIMLTSDGNINLLSYEDWNFLEINLKNNSTMKIRQIYEYEY